MQLLGTKAAIAAGALALYACDDSEPNQQSADYVSAYAGLDAGPRTVRPEGSSRDAGPPSSWSRSDAAVRPVADASDETASNGDGAVIAQPDGGITDLTIGGDADSRADDAAVDSGRADDAGSGAVDASSARPDAGPPAPQAVTIRFKAVIGARDFACGQTFTSVGSSNVSVRPRDFHFLVESVRLINAQGTEVPLQMETRLPFQEQGVALVDFENNTGGCSGTPERNSEITGTVPADDYRGIVFVNGVPSALNHVDPAMAPAPLRLAGRDWSRLGGYPFVAAELGRPDDAPGYAVLHSGSVDCVEQGSEVSCGRPNRTQVRLLNFNPARNTIIADLDVLFAPIDLAAETSCNGGGEGCAQLYPLLGIDIDSGQPSATQRLYRVGE